MDGGRGGCVCVCLEGKRVKDVNISGESYCEYSPVSILQIYVKVICTVCRFQSVLIQLLLLLCTSF